jgi:hypothetical protein
VIGVINGNAHSVYGTNRFVGKNESAYETGKLADVSG